MSPRIAREQAHADEMGIQTIRRLIEGKAITYRRVTCAFCGRSLEVRHADGAPAGAVRRTFEAKGWAGFGRQLACPACAFDRQKPARTRKDRETIMTTSGSAPAREASVPAHALEQARPATAREIVRLDEKFDSVFVDSRYLAGWSDRRVGDELNIPAATVARVREDLGLTLREDPAITALRSDIEQIELMVAELRQRLEALPGAAAT